MNKTINSSVAFLILVLIALICGIFIARNFQKKIEVDTESMIQQFNSDTLSPTKVNIKNK